jgi:type IV pilus assembly protein PilO
MALGGLSFSGGLKQQLLVAALALGGGSYVFYSYYIAPIQIQIQGQENRIQKLRQEVQEGQEIESRLPVFREKIAEQRKHLANFRRTLPSEKETPELMRRMQQMAADNKLQIRSFKSQETVKRDFYVDWPIDIWVEGSYHNLATFFQSIGELARLVNITDLSIRSVEGGTNRERTITATCTATTFVFLEEGP